MTAVRRMGPSYQPSEGSASIRESLRALRDSGVRHDVSGDTAPLETQQRSEDPARLETATPIERDSVTARQVAGDITPGIGAFLDGIQRSRVLAHVGAVPLVHGAVAAAIRIRTDRRLRTWSEPLIDQAVYVPAAALPDDVHAALSAHVVLRDTGAERDAHPQLYAARALTAVQRSRERAETALAEQWVASGQGPLLIDGGISGSGSAARHPLAIGVVKSHRTLYISGESLGVVLGLREGERTTAVELSSPRRVPVATWYLRLRGSGARAPLFGLVRVEVAREGEGDIATRADVVSRWLLAERSPVSLPDSRWDVMVYGIRECEQYLKAILT